jgi:hypothetical protein
MVAKCPRRARRAVASRYPHELRGDLAPATAFGRKSSDVRQDRPKPTLPLRLRPRAQGLLLSARTGQSGSPADEGFMPESVWQVAVFPLDVQIGDRPHARPALTW